MKAIRYHQVGGPEVLRWEDAPEPVPGPGQVLVRVHAAGVNFADTERRRGLYDAQAPLPRILGSEAAGVVRAVGPGVDASWVGRRVVALTKEAYAEAALAPVEELLVLPPEVSFEEAAALLVQGLTAYHVVHTVGRVEAGQTVLIHAAAGGVGLLAVQLAKAAGARVIGTVSGEAKAKLARDVGADAVIRYDQEDVAASVRELTQGRGVERVLDSVGASTWQASLDALAPFGHLVSYGNASGHPPHVEVESLYAKSLTVGAYWLRTPTPPEVQRKAREALLAEVVAKRLRIVVGLALPLSRAEEAHRQLEGRGTVGKVVLLGSD
ncbi:quinone oxidoreductase [Corallococcus exiguus]|uniref:quinone oxidoreductase family protein n=1 Tax=Corallococcus TaxID=83461 RepID=UPI000EC7F678|nr:MULTISPECIES: quinone oxidoreductase [Corallococcus]NNB87935.1 quinone oxidoreductase [Corallococcus exiguus]NNC05195.1 quinone oxidoreductase [Corallococcus exiguus]NPC46334.1 quinone oxidoreductase [Corallococcus exiguus]RKH82464.1 quinone oxidoreductase [Corallococcus sp. AB032C]